METCNSTPVSLLLYFLNNSCSETFSNSTFYSSPPFFLYLGLFALTNLIEFPVYYLYLKKWHGLKKSLAMVLFLNLCTHPLVVFVFQYLCDRYDLKYGTYLLISEVFAPVLEGALLYQFTKESILKSQGVAWIANLFSWGIGIRLILLLRVWHLS